MLAAWPLTIPARQIGRAFPARAPLPALLTLLALLATPTQAQEWVYTVRPGDTLWSIATEHMTRIEDWPRLQALNQVADPNTLPPGMKLRIPIGWLKRQPTTARVVNTRGQAHVVLATSGQTITLTPGQQLHSGDQIQTGPDSDITLEFGDGSQLLLQADSTLNLDTLAAYGATDQVDTVLHLQRGRTENQVKPRAAFGPRYEIRTPAAAAGVRGTRYRVGMEPAAATARTEVLEGHVAFQGGRQTRNVTQGFGSLGVTGQPPSPPILLLKPPKVADLPPVITRSPFQLPLPALEGAVAYRVQIAPDTQFTSLLFDRVVSTPSLSGPDLPDGAYALRLRGIDAKGLEGRDAIHSFRLHARPEPPFLTEPAHDSTVLQQALAFAWAEPQNAAAYHFQLAADEQFSAPLLDKAEVGAARLTPDQPLAPGRYYWRVAVRDTTGRIGPFSDPQAFRLQATPQLQAPEVAADSLSFHWGAGAPGQHYEFQLARDSDFTDLVVSQRLTEPQLRMPRPDSGFYYLRIRVIEADGAGGPYGPVQRITVPPASYWPMGLVVLLALVLAL